MTDGNARRRAAGLVAVLGQNRWGEAWNDRDLDLRDRSGRHDPAGGFRLTLAPLERDQGRTPAGVVRDDQRLARREPSDECPGQQKPQQYRPSEMQHAGTSQRGKHRN
jgi:hypothetical protein